MNRPCRTCWRASSSAAFAALNVRTLNRLPSYKNGSTTHVQRELVRFRRSELYRAGSAGAQLESVDRTPVRSAPDRPFHGEGLNPGPAPGKTNSVASAKPYVGSPGKRREPPYVMLASAKWLASRALPQAETRTRRTQLRTIADYGDLCDLQKSQSRCKSNWLRAHFVSHPAVVPHFRAVELHHPRKREIGKPS